MLLNIKYSIPYSTVSTLLLYGYEIMYQACAEKSHNKKKILFTLSSLTPFTSVITCLLPISRSFKLVKFIFWTKILIQYSKFNTSQTIYF